MLLPEVHPDQYRTFFSLPSFIRDAKALGMTDRDEVTMMAELMVRVDQWPVVRGCQGLRKMRFALPSRNQGRSGACRVYYAHFPIYGVILLAAIFGKNAKADLAQDQKQVLSRLIELIESKLKKKRLKKS